jgi:hypothetical protein
MLRSILSRVLALVLCLTLVGALIAAEGTVTKVEGKGKDAKVTVKIGDKETTFSGAEVKLPKEVKVGDKVETVEKDGKVVGLKAAK